jgi:predicted DNA-binding transcriptional regulator AlpA
MHTDQTPHEIHVSTPAAVPKLLRFKDLKRLGYVANWVSLHRWIKEQGFPVGKMIGPRSRAWTESEVALWFAQRPDGKGGCSSEEAK